jgi:hypothetical protein
MVGLQTITTLSRLLAVIVPIAVAMQAPEGDLGESEDRRQAVQEDPGGLASGRAAARSRFGCHRKCDLPPLDFGDRVEDAPGGSTDVTVRDVAQPDN